MKKIQKFKCLYLIILWGLIQNCSQTKISGFREKNSAQEYYTIDDFKSVDKFDTHFHINTDDTAFIKQSEEDNFRLLDIVDDRPFGLPMEEQQKFAVLQVKAFPDRIAFATTFSVKNWNNDDWQEQTIAYIKNAISNGAIAVKVWKNIGMDLKDKNGKFVMIDNPRFDPIFEYLAKNRITLIGHNGEPRDCWLPLEKMTVRGNNSYYSQHPEYHMYLHPEYPSYEDQINARDHMLEKHPDLKFIGCHLGSLEWSLDELAKRLDKFPNMAVDLSRMTNLQIHAKTNWQKTHDFFIKYQDRLIFGTDRTIEKTKNPSGLKKNIHDSWIRSWRFFTTDEMIVGSEVDGEFKGLKLPREVIDKIYRKNAEKWLPGINKAYPDRPGKIVRVSTVEGLQQAVLSAGTNETILIAEGTYHLQRSLLIENKAHFTLQGASADAAKVILQGGGWEGGNPTDVIVIRSSDDIAIADLTITEARSYGIKVEAYADEPHPGNIHILRCHFLNIGTRAIKGTAPKDQKPLVGGSVRFCRFENTKVPDRSWLYNGDYISAIDMMYLKDWVFSDNVFKNIRGANGGGRGAIFIWNQSRNVVVERNVFVGCDRSIAFGNPSEPTNYEPGTLHNYDGIIRNNFIVAGNQGGKGIEVIWADNVQVCNNTVYTPDQQYLAIHYFQKISRLLIANNLVRGRLFGEGEARLEGNVIGDLDGYFVNPAEGDLHLTTFALKALGKGVQLTGVSDDIDGQSRKKYPDVGADQR